MSKSFMKNRILGVLFVLVAGGLAGSAMTAAPVSAQCSENFITFPTWYRGLTTGEDCQIMSPSEVGGLSTFIWRIGLNVVEILLQLVGYVSVLFIIYGGFLFITSTGSPDGAAKARQTIMNAVIGLVISIASVGIINFIFSYVIR